MQSEFIRQIPYFVTIVVLFTGFGVAVRRGALKGRQILRIGAIVGALAVLSSLIFIWGEYQRGIPIPLLIMHPIMMALVSAYCIWLPWRTHQVQTVSEQMSGDTRIQILSCLPAAIPESEAMILPGNTALRLAGGLTGAIGFACGKEVEENLRKEAPVGIGKVVETGGGKLSVNKIYHVAVQDPMKPTLASALKRGMESALLAARKAEISTLIVPLGSLQGLGASECMNLMVESALRQRRAFSAISFVIPDSRNIPAAKEAVERLLQTESEKSDEIEEAPEPEKTPTTRGKKRRR